MLVAGVREYRAVSACPWKRYLVVLSGSYLYFYQGQDLTPYHYIYVLSLTVHEHQQH